MNRSISTVIGALVFAAGAAATAHADETGFYGEVRAGAAFREDADNNGSVGGSSEFDTGPSLGGAVGYSFGRGNDFGIPQLKNFRAEFEYLRQENDLNGLGTTAIAGGPGDSDNETTMNAFMFNLYYDHDTGTPWKPYLGGGVGGAIVNFEASSGGQGVVDDEDAVFAYQVRTGIGYELTPTTQISLGYRFFDTLDPDFRAADGSSFESEYRSHTAELGFRVYF